MLIGVKTEAGAVDVKVRGVDRFDKCRLQRVKICRKFEENYGGENTKLVRNSENYFLHVCIFKKKLFKIRMKSKENSKKIPVGGPQGRDYDAPREGYTLPFSNLSHPLL